MCVNFCRLFISFELHAEWLLVATYKLQSQRQQSCKICVMTVESVEFSDNDVSMNADKSDELSCMCKQSQVPLSLTNNSNFTITHCEKNHSNSVMKKLEFCNGDLCSFISPTIKSPIPS